ncbi:MULTISPECIES: amino acid adenylation domain-containing protein [Streptomyces]|uniref:amino acid adenylation domain-containing protein n=1 Tax=Streptomyces TaxID=1883 RepID=UPI00345BB415
MSSSAAVEPGRACHGLAVRLPSAPRTDELQARLTRATGCRPALKNLRLWAEPVGLPSGDPVALRRRAAEARRALAPGGPGLRAVLLAYDDGPADLVLVAHRAVLGREGLARLASALTAADVAPPAVGEPPAACEAPTATRRLPAWGLGDPGRAGAHAAVALNVKARASDEDLLAAVPLVLARYEEGERPGTGVVREEEEKECGGPPDFPDGERPSVGTVLTRARPGQVYEPCAAPLFPLTLWWERGEDGTVRGECRFDEDAMASEIAVRFARQVLRTAERLGNRSPGACGADGAATSAEAACMTAEEAAEVLAAGSAPAPAGHTPVTIHAAFEAVAAAQPEAVAYSGPDGTLGYAELDRRAEHRARALRRLGAGPGTLVGVCLERGADPVTVMLAVLKSGAAYVPMDVRHPRERLRNTAEDAGVAVVVAGAAGFPAPDGIRVTSPEELDRVGDDCPADDGTGAGRRAAPEDPAYVIFTSGSTGRPKGVVVPHRNVSALLAATRHDMRLGPGDVWTWFHSGAFDFSVWEIWGCLLTGGRLVAVPYWASREAGEFRALLAAERVTVLSQTPSAFAQLIEADRGAAGDLAVRLVVLGGEPLDVRVLKGWFDRHPPAHCRVVNMFGITETTVHVTSRTVTAREMVRRSRSVGTALPGWSVSVRDAEGRPVPFGAAGEIWVGGTGVALHYLGRPDLTAERFVEDPFGGGRMYRSGDRGRLRPDGGLDHLGRMDNQVQLRGFRIELDEIRAGLLEHPAVRAAGVVMAAGPDGDPAGARLDAYVVLGAPASPSGIRGRLGRTLPDYMVPSTVTVVEELPLTVNGKVDTARLPPPAPGTADDGTAEAAAPGGEGPVHVILDIWRRVLGTAVTADDDFFELGGNSLLAVRISAAMRDAGLPSVGLREFYLNPTVRGLEAAMTAR